MGLREAIKSVLPPSGKSAADLSKQIAALTESVAGLTAEHAAADAVATEAASDPTRYTEAAAKAAEIALHLSRESERLGRLRRARDEIASREQAAYVEELQARLNEIEAGYPNARAQIHHAREAEERRHREALQEFARQEGGAENALREAKRALRLAQAGVTRQTAGRLADLSDGIRKVHEKYGQDLPVRAMQAETRRCSTEMSCKQLAAARGCDEAKVSLQAELKEVTAEAAMLARQWEEMKAELNPLLEELERVRSTIPEVLR